MNVNQTSSRERKGEKGDTGTGGAGLGGGDRLSQRGGEETQNAI